ncbi:MAG: hypothetical protein K6C69_01560 [Lachnospiraceae bacterium]|nr:hypothetical protein [Lachnospiraceae bacterium]
MSSTTVLAALVSLFLALTGRVQDLEQHKIELGSASPCIVIMRGERGDTAGADASADGNANGEVGAGDDAGAGAGDVGVSACGNANGEVGAGDIGASACGNANGEVGASDVGVSADGNANGEVDAGDIGVSAEDGVDGSKTVTAWCFDCEMNSLGWTEVSMEAWDRHFYGLFTPSPETAYVIFLNEQDEILDVNLGEERQDEEESDGAVLMLCQVDEGVYVQGSFSGIASESVPKDDSSRGEVSARKDDSGRGEVSAREDDSGREEVSAREDDSSREEVSAREDVSFAVVGDMDKVSSYETKHPSKFLKDLVAMDQSGEMKIYSSISRAVSSIDDGEEVLVLVLPGTYKENVKAWEKKVHLLGLSREDVVLTTSSSSYSSPAIEIAAGSLDSMTIRCTGSCPGEGKAGAYAIHVESDNLYQETLRIENCEISSTSNTGIGMGMRGGCDVSFIDCAISGVDYAFFVHDGAYSKSTGLQKLLVSGCDLDDAGSLEACRFDSQGVSGARVELAFLNNTGCEIQANNQGGRGKDDNFMGLKNFYLNPRSTGNEEPVMNAR